MFEILEHFFFFFFYFSHTIHTICIGFECQPTRYDAVPDILAAADTVTVIVYESPDFNF